MTGETLGLWIFDHALRGISGEGLKTPPPCFGESPDIPLHHTKEFTGPLDQRVVLLTGFQQIEDEYRAVGKGLSSLHCLQRFSIGIDVMNASERIIKRIPFLYYHGLDVIPLPVVLWILHEGTLLPDWYYSAGKKKAQGQARGDDEDPLSIHNGFLLSRLIRFFAVAMAIKAR